MYIENMPKPTTPLSTDHILYTNIYNPLATKLCFIHPNYVTAASLLLTIPIVFSLLHGSALIPFLLVIGLRMILDCMDGAIARACNLKSKFGSLFDKAADNILHIAIVVTLVYILSIKYGFTAWKTQLILWFGVISTISNLYTAFLMEEDEQMANMHDLVVLVHDNMLLAGLLYGAVVWSVANVF